MTSEKSGVTHNPRANLNDFAFTLSVHSAPTKPSRSIVQYVEPSRRLVAAGLDLSGQLVADHVVAGSRTQGAVERIPCQPRLRPSTAPSTSGMRRKEHHNDEQP